MAYNNHSILLELLNVSNTTFTQLSINQPDSFDYDKNPFDIEDIFTKLNYDKYVFFAIASALFGLPGNILLLVILIKISLSRGRNHLSSGSFERFLFEIVLIDTLLIIYHFIDNLLSYIYGERSAGQHYLIHISDFCCKFFTYIAKMSVLLTTWLLLFLIINRIILIEQSCWNRKCIRFVNAKYTTVFLIFIFSVYNIYPIEILKYQKKIDLQDYQPGTDGVCSATDMEGKSNRMLQATNYGYNLIGIAFPCILILLMSAFLICRVSMKNRMLSKQASIFSYTKNNGEIQQSDRISSHYYASSCYIVAIVGILHALFNLPARLSDTLLLALSPYSKKYTNLISFSHEAQSIMSLSYTYKWFVCILLCQRFRSQAKRIICFLIENKYTHQSMLKKHHLNNKFMQQKRVRQQQQQQQQQGASIVNCSIEKPEQVSVILSKTNISSEEDRKILSQKQLFVQENQFSSKSKSNIYHNQNDKKIFIIENYSWSTSWLRPFTKTLIARYRLKDKHCIPLIRSSSCQPFIHSKPKVQNSSTDNKNVSLISSINNVMELSTSNGTIASPTKQHMIDKQKIDSNPIYSQTSTDLSYFSLPGGGTYTNLPMPKKRAPCQNIIITNQTRIRKTSKTNGIISTNPQNLQNFLSFSYALCNNY